MEAFIRTCFGLSFMKTDADGHRYSQRLEFDSALEIRSPLAKSKVKRPEHNNILADSSFDADIYAMSARHPQA